MPLPILSRAAVRSRIACSRFFRSIATNSPAASPRPQIGTRKSSFLVSMRMLPGSVMNSSGMS